MRQKIGCVPIVFNELLGRKKGTDNGRPRVFVSSTYYDLRIVRADLERFIKEMGYEAVLYEKAIFPMDEKRHSNILVTEKSKSAISSFPLSVEDTARSRRIISIQ